MLFSFSSSIQHFISFRISLVESKKQVFINQTMNYLMDFSQQINSVINQLEIIVFSKQNNIFITSYNKKNTRILNIF